jgi:hypothetical protein
MHHPILDLAALFQVLHHDSGELYSDIKDAAGWRFANRTFT